MVTEDEIAEVLVVGQQDSTFLKGNCQDLPVGQSLRKVSSAHNDTMPLAYEERRQSEWDPFVEKEIHRGTNAVIFSRGVDSTRVWANAKHALTSSMVSRG